MAALLCSSAGAISLRHPVLGRNYHAPKLAGIETSDFALICAMSDCQTLLIDCQTLQVSSPELHCLYVGNLVQQHAET